MSTRAYMVEFLTEGGKAADCHPDFFETTEAAEAAGAEMIHELPWATSYRVVPTDLD